MFSNKKSTMLFVYDAQQVAESRKQKRWTPINKRITYSISHICAQL